jgi:translation initiation factor 2B subunit (eIF-2B alpha/beta/delta family)
MFERFKFNRICRRIKEIKIQGATNVAKAALDAYFMFPNEKTRKILLSLRPTEPLLSHVLHLAGKVPKLKILSHFEETQDIINKYVFRLIKTNQVIFTHCHSTGVVKALIYAKKHGKHFEVYNTETRPLFQGRRTAKELAQAGIRVTNFVDSASAIALKKEQGTRKVNLVLLGADALLKDAIINKVGSGMISQIAKDNKIPVYVVSDSWKYAHNKVKLEKRHFFEVWNPKINKIHIQNPAFEDIEPKNIKAIISEFGILRYKDFLKKVEKR